LQVVLLSLIALSLKRVHLNFGKKFDKERKEKEKIYKYKIYIKKTTKDKEKKY